MNYLLQQIADIMQAHMSANALARSWTASQWCDYWEESVVHYRPITSAELMGWAAVGTRWQTLEHIKNNLRDSPLYGATCVLFSMMSNVNAHIDYNNTQHQLMLHIYVRLNIFNEADLEELLMIGRSFIPRWQQRGWVESHSGDFQYLLNNYKFAFE